MTANASLGSFFVPLIIRRDRVVQSFRAVPITSIASSND